MIHNKAMIIFSHRLTLAQYPGQQLWKPETTLNKHRLLLPQLKLHDKPPTALLSHGRSQVLHTTPKGGVDNGYKSTTCVFCALMK